MELELVCVRHGKTQWNKDKRYLGHTDIGLLHESLTELLPVRKALEGVLFQKVFCSDLTRCRETLEWIYPASKIGVSYDQRLREMDFGDWEGHTYDQLKGSSIYREWLGNPKAVTPPGGEAWEHFQERLTDFMGSLTPLVKKESKDSNRVLVVTHGGVIRQLAAMTIAGSSFWDFSADPGTLLTLKLTFEGDNWTGHL